MNRSTLYATELDDAFIALLTLTSATAVIRVTDWDVEIVSNGITYLPEAFTVILPPSTDESPPRAAIRVDNATLTFITVIRSVTETLTAEVTIVSANDPDTVEIGPFVFEVRGASFDAGSVELDLAYEPILDLAVPHHVFSPSQFPGLFR